MALSRFVLPFADVGSGIRPSSGAKLFFFETGTSTPRDTYNCPDGSTANSNPVIADSRGVFPNIFFNGVFKVILQDRNSVQQWEADPVESFLTSTSLTGSSSFDTLQTAIATNKVIIGDGVTTLGYTAPGDGGGASYIVVAGGTGVDDGGSFLDMANGNQLQLCVEKGEVTAESFGVLVSNANNLTNLNNLATFTGDRYKIVFRNNDDIATTGEWVTSSGSQDIDGNGSRILFSNTGLGIRFQQNEFLRASATTDYTTGDAFITIDDITGVAIGDLIGVRSSTLFNTSRVDFYRGGNCLVERLVGNDVYISMPFPFDMTSASLVDDGTIGIGFTKPKHFRMKNMRVKNSVSADNGSIGIFLNRDVGSRIENVDSQSYTFSCMDLLRSVNAEIHQYSSSDALGTTGTTNYGMSLRSTTNILVTTSNIMGGRVGLDTGGSEPTYNVVVDNCFLKSELGAFGFSNHNNAYSNKITNSSLFGIKVAGHTTVSNCLIDRNIGTGTDFHFLGVADNQADNSYLFEQCTFLREPIFRLEGSSNTGSLTRNQVGPIVFKQCTGFDRIVMDLEAGFGSPITADIEKIKVEDCDGLRLQMNDNCEHVIIKDTKSLIVDQFLEQITKGVLTRIDIENCKIPEITQAIILNNFGELWVTNCEGQDVSSANPSFNTDSAAGKIHILGCNFANFTSGWDVPTSLDTISVNDTVMTLDGSTLALITTKKGDFFNKRGSETGVTDGSGEFTISHGLGFAPSESFLQVTGSTLFNVNARTVGSTGIIVRAFNSGGAVLGSGISVPVNWHVKP